MSRKNISLVTAALILLTAILLAYYGFSQQSAAPKMADLIEAPSVLANTTSPSTLVPPRLATTKHEGRQQRREEVSSQKKDKDVENLVIAPHIITIDELLRSDKPADQAAALGRIRALAAQQPKALQKGLVRWLPALLSQGRFDDIEAFCRVAILFKPQDTPSVAAEQRARVVAALTAGTFDQALPLARGYYGVAALDQEQDAKLLVAQALNRRIGSNGVSLSDPATVASVGNVLQSTAIDASTYSAEIDKLAKPASFNNCIGRGNLLLLAGRPADALAAFEASVASLDPTDKSDQKRIPVSADGIARSVRALEASPARSDALVAAIRRSDLSSVRSISAPLATALAGSFYFQQTGRRLALSTDRPAATPAAGQP